MRPHEEEWKLDGTWDLWIGKDRIASFMTDYPGHPHQDADEARAKLAAQAPAMASLLLLLTHVRGKADPAQLLLALAQEAEEILRKAGVLG